MGDSHWSANTNIDGSDCKILRGKIDYRRQLITWLPFFVGNGDIQNGMVLVDTGFNGAVLLWQSDLSELNIERDESLVERIMLADGSKGNVYLQEISFRWFGEITRVWAHVLRGNRPENEPCKIGMELLLGMVIEIDEDSFCLRKR